LVVIAPSSGKITYWEDISSAAIPGLGREKQNGFQGSAGLLTGEVVTTIENAEPAGFILTFSSSRVAHLTVRDPQGKPSVNVEFLRDAGYRSSGGGLFGSVRNIFGGGGWRKDVAAVRAGRTRQRGQRDLVIATKTGTFELWDAFWSIGNSKRGQVDAKDALLQALKPTVTGDDSQNSFHFQVLDFAFGAEQKDKSELAIAGKNAPTPLVVLVMLAEQMSVNYYLVEMTVDNDGVDVEIVHPITCYKGLLEQRNSWKPRLVLPKPGNMAFVIFPTAIVLFSLVRVEESPSSQLAVETDSLPPPFQDCIDFRDQAYQIKGLGIEDQGTDHKFPSCVLMVEGCGVIRVLTYPQREIEGIPQPAKVTAKSKLEQAVFFGTLNQNPIDFSAREEQQFSLQEINAAALEIQEEILKSASKFLPSVTPVLEHQLRLRAKALEDLAVYLRRQYPPLPRNTRWLLLAGAEKMAASRTLWKVEEASTKTKADDEKTLLAMMLQYIHEHHKSLIDPSKGEHDQIRHWFAHDTGKVGIVIPWSFQVLKEAYRDGVKSEMDLVARICEANDILLATVDTAFKFRQTNASLYGLGDEDLTDGVLGSDYEGLPEFWTSSKPGLNQTRELLTTVQKTAGTNFTKQSVDTPRPDMVDKLKHDAPRLVEIYSQMVDERSRWCIVQGSPKLRHEGEELRADQVSDRRQLILEVGESGLVNEAIALAVKYKDMETLVELMNVTTGEIRQKLAQPGISDDDKEALETKLEYWHNEIASYFGTFGDDWAQALFKRQIDDGLHGTLLYQTQFQSYLTRFFERNPGYEQLSWMNDVTGEGNYERASAHLNNLAVSEQSNVWRKKVELSLGRLAELALVEDKYKGDPAKRVENAKKAVKPKAFKRQVALLDIQDLLYSHVQPAIGGAIDEAAEIQLVHEQFAEEMVKDLPALAQLLKQGLTRLIASEVMSAEELIDVLTLMDIVYYGEDNESEVVGHEFYLALRCLDFSDLDSARKALLEKIIWRRCMIRDDWVAINKTVKKDDAQIEAETDATALFKTLREGFQNCESILRDAYAYAYSACFTDLTSVLPRPISPRLRLQATCSLCYP
jgi:nuclear pore complex protein Nup133